MSISSRLYAAAFLICSANVSAADSIEVRWLSPTGTHFNRGSVAAPSFHARFGVCAEQTFVWTVEYYNPYENSTVDVSTSFYANTATKPNWCSLTTYYEVEAWLDTECYQSGMLNWLGVTVTDYYSSTDSDAAFFESQACAPSGFSLASLSFDESSYFGKQARSLPCQGDSVPEIFALPRPRFSLRAA